MRADGTKRNRIQCPTGMCKTTPLLGYKLFPVDLTSIGDVEFDPKVSIGASGVATGGEDDPSDGLYLPDDAGHSWGGQDSVVADNQPPNLEDHSETHCLFILLIIHQQSLRNLFIFAL